MNAEYATRYTRCSIGSPARLPRLRGFRALRGRQGRGPVRRTRPGWFSKLRWLRGFATTLTCSSMRSDLRHSDSALAGLSFACSPLTEKERAMIAAVRKNGATRQAGPQMQGSRFSQWQSALWWIAAADIAVRWCVGGFSVRRPARQAGNSIPDDRLIAFDKRRPGTSSKIRTPGSLCRMVRSAAGALSRPRKYKID